MSAFRIQGIPAAVAAEVRETMKAPGYGHPAYRESARGSGPCRECLRTFAVGQEDRILFTYQPFGEPGSLPAPGPVFIHAKPCVRYDAPALPPDFRALPLVFEAYGRGGRLVVQERARADDPDELLDRMFDLSGTEYVHVRNGEAGCFMARVDRDSARD